MTTSTHFMRYNPDDPDQCNDAARFLDECADTPGNAGDPKRMRQEAKELRERAARLLGNEQD